MIFHRYTLLCWLLHKWKESSLIPTLRSETLADISTKAFSQTLATFSDLKVGIRELAFLEVHAFPLMALVYMLSRGFVSNMMYIQANYKHRVKQLVCPSVKISLGL